MALAWLAWIGIIAATLILGSLGVVPGVFTSKPVLLLLFVPIFALPAIAALVTGCAPAKGGDFYRSRQPVKFWLATAFYGLGAIAFLVAGIAKALGV